MVQSLTRIHVQLALILALCFAGVGYAVYLGLRDLQQTMYHEQASHTVLHASEAIEALLGRQQQALSKLAAQPGLAASVARGATAELARRAEDGKSALAAVSVEFVPWDSGTTATLEADALDYLRRQATSSTLSVPEFGAIGTDHPYYRMSAPILDERRQRVGFVLAKFKSDALRDILKDAAPPGAYLALQQVPARGTAQTALSVGAPAGDDSGFVIGELGATHWNLLHQPVVRPPALLAGQRIYYFLAAGVLFVLSLSILWRASRKTNRAVRHDIRSLIRMFHDLREGSMRVSYPMELREFSEAFDHLRERGQKLVEEKEKLKGMGLIDHLSQLGNRRHFETRLKELFESSKANGPSSVLIIDMDHFKQVNDKHGHDVGDALIVGFAQALRKVVRQSDVLCRLGGDEFCIIYTYAPLNKAATLVERLRRQLPREIPLTKGVIHQLRWTGGLSAMHDKDTKPDDVLWRADQALLQAKEAGRNVTKVCDPITGVAAKKSIMAS